MKSKKFKGYRTIVFNLVMAGLVVAGVNDEDTMKLVAENLDASLTALGTLWTTGNVLLRVVTSSPVFKKE